MTFQRENRYIVVKIKDLDQQQEEGLRGVMYGYHIPTRECLVIESDWPEYEPAWRMIQARVEGATLSPAHIEDGEEVAALKAEVAFLKAMSDSHFAIARDYHLEIERLKAALSAPPAADPWTPSGADYDRNIHHNPDAKAWADLFVATFPGLADKHGLMIGWFSNAMMAMHDWLKSKEEAAPPAAGVPEGKLLVSAEPLRRVLNALVNAPHQIRELQATREPVALFADNPINILIAEYNAAHGDDE